MKCCIVRDLLPGYIDGLTSEETNEEIKQHLEDCSDCRLVYEQMTATIPIEIKEEEKDIDFVKKLKSRIRQRYIWIALTTCIIVISLMYFAKNYRIPIAYDPKYMVTETYQAVPEQNQYGLTYWRDLTFQSSDTIKAAKDGEIEVVNLIRLAVRESIENDDVASVGRTIERNGTNVRVVYYCYTKTLWNSLFGGSHAFADSFVTTGDIYEDRLYHAEYKPVMTEIYYLPKGNMGQLEWLSDEEFEQQKEHATLVWSGIN